MARRPSERDRRQLRPLKTYAKVARMGAPTATQVADRWHLLVNASEALRGIFERHQSEIRDVAWCTAPYMPPPAPTVRRRKCQRHRCTIHDAAAAAGPTDHEDVAGGLRSLGGTVSTLQVTVAQPELASRLNPPQMRDEATRLGSKQWSSSGKIGIVARLALMDGRGESGRERAEMWSCARAGPTDRGTDTANRGATDGDLSAG